MAEATAKLGTVHGVTDPASVALGRTRNARRIDPILLRPPKRFIYLFTISKRTFEIAQPPLFPRLMVPACTTERYKLFATIPDPVLQAETELESDDIRVFGHDGAGAAQSLCNPNNYGARGDYTEKDVAEIIALQNVLPAGGLGYGVNLNVQGVFWSLTNPPSEAEIAAAEARRETYYTRLIEQARVLEISNPKQLNDELNQDFHMAAEHFGLETSWHRTLIKRTECPNCGESVKPNVAYHINQAGLVCVIDMERAQKAGLFAPTK